MFVSIKNNRVLADGTYKIICERFPVLTIGTTDCNRSLHQFGYGIVSRERIEDYEFLFAAVKKGVRLAHGNILILFVFVICAFMSSKY